MTYYKNRKEIQYYNNGDIYKESAVVPDYSEAFRYTVSTPSGINTEYVQLHSETEKAFNFQAVKEKDGVIQTKRYIASPEYSELVEVDSENDFSLVDFDVSPDINLVVAIGIYDDIATQKDFFFHVPSYSLLEAVALYYSLPVPITESMFNSFGEDSVFHTTANELDIVVAGVVFENNIPVRFKFYNFPFEV